MTIAALCAGAGFAVGNAAPFMLIKSNRWRKERMGIPYRRTSRAKTILDGVERWIEGCMLLREIKIDHFSRLDGLLIPVSMAAPNMVRQTHRYFWDRAGVIGIEVKANRADFLKGLNSGQFERYDKSLSGVYVATSKGVCKTSEIPKEIGHLIVNYKKDHRPMAICRRHPIFSEPEFEPELLWRIFFRAMQESREREAKQRQKYYELSDRIGKIASAKIFHALREIQRSVEES